MRGDSEPGGGGGGSGALGSGAISRLGGGGSGSAALSHGAIDRQGDVRRKRREVALLPTRLISIREALSTS